jgi:flavin reductase (DIM6/NTAB) family NADH-FMN oxidoreductase RutF
MRFDLDKVEKPVAYKLMTATIVPRPIAWVTTKAEDGTLNAAPYSYFNAMGNNPPTVVLGLLRDPAKGLKDTAGNIIATGEFVVNLVPERLADAMNLTAMDAPAEVDELEAAGLTPAESTHVGVPRIAESPVSFECVNHSTLVTGPRQVLAVGRVLAIHIDDRYILDAERGHIDTPALTLIGRMHGGGTYTRTGDTFELQRPTYAEWVKGRQG